MQANGWPQRAGTVVLQIALTRLAKHYGLIADDLSQSRKRLMRHWGAADYRPRIDRERGEACSPNDSEP